jgi:hypothetical protein
MSRFLIFCTLILALSCKTTRQNTGNEFPMVMMEKTACMGNCPTYLFNVYPDGTTTYRGTKNVEHIGEYTAFLTEDQLSYLKNSFEEANFFDFADVYSANLTDLPTTFIYYHNGKENHKVTDYYGAPEALKNLEDKIEAFIATIDWQKK